MKRENIEDLYPLTPLQEGILYQVRRAPKRSDYINRTAWDFHGAFDPERFREVWRRLIRRHPILRTGFFWRHSENPVQIVHKKAEFSGDVLDWRGKDNQDQAFAWWLKADLKKGFDLHAPPLMRLTTMRLGQDHWRIVWTRHHLLLDGWSGAMLLREAFLAYSGADLPQAPKPFRNFVGWLKQKKTEDAESWWRGQLQGLDQPTPVGPQKSEAMPGGERIEVEHELAFDMKLPGLTQNTLVQGAWALLLERFSGSGDVLFGSTVSGRSSELPGLEQMIGVFINTLPLRVKVDHGDSCRTWLTQLQRHMAAMRAYEHHPLSEIRTWSNIPATLPMFRSIVVFENYPVDHELKKTGIGSQIELVFRDERTHYPLALYALPGQDRLALRLCFDSGMFDAEMAQAMLRHVANILRQFCQNPGQKLSQIALTGPEQTHALYRQWNQTDLALPEPSTIIHLLRAQLQKTPDATALEFGAVRLTYEALHQAADRVCARLCALNLPPETRIGVALPRGREMVVALLGILKAGLSYLPLDTRFPEDRLEYIVADSGVAHVFSDRSHNWLSDEKLLLWSEKEMTRLPASDPEPMQRAYTIYTSGSTGRPKGVDISHLAVVNLLISASTQPGLKEGDRFLALTTLSFDISVLELFLPLVTGATLIVADEDTAADPDLLASALTDVTHAQATPATWKMLYTTGWRGNARLRVWCGGEASPPDLVHALARDTTGFWNMYGPTETTVWSAILPIEDGEPVYLGGPLTNTSLHILDPVGRPLPPGFTGELFIAGSGLARGYHQRPSLTAERFLPDPNGAGARWYRTGDLGIRLSDGRIQFLGRSDSQVKVRGYRIETGEIESVLRRHADVGEAVVAAEPDQNGETILVAFIQMNQDEPAERGLRSFLAQTLPQYMLPDFFSFHLEFPLTPNAKIDRLALRKGWRENKGAGGALAKINQGPRDDREAAMLPLFAETLGVESLCITDNFFELGGHSLQATRLLARVRKELKLHIPLRDFFRKPTVAAMAVYAEPVLNQISIPANPVESSFPLSPAQKRFLFLHQFEDQSSAYHIATAFEVDGDLDKDALDRSFANLMNRHDILRTVYSDDQQHIKPLLARPIRRDFQAQTDAESLCRDAISDDIRREFDLTREAPIRMTVYQLAPSRFILLLTAHHIALDAQSVDIAVSDLVGFYRVETEGLPVNLTELSIRYGDYATWLQGQEYEASGAWWRDKLKDLQPLRLPIDKQRPPLQTFRGARVEFEIPNCAGLQQLCADYGVTMFMSMMSAFKIHLARWSGQSDFAVGAPMSGRDQPETEPLLGCFINNLVMRTDLSGQPTYAEVLNRVRKTALDAVHHRDIPFETLVSLVDAPRDLARAPLFQVLLNFRVEENEPTLAQTLDWKRLVLDDASSKYELSLIVRQRGDQLSAALEYNSDLFSEQSITDCRDQLLLVIEDMVAHPQHIPNWPQFTAQQTALASQPAELAESGLWPAEEALLMKLFTQVLGQPLSHPGQSFFEHGGHSLSAARLIGRLREEYDIRLTLKTFFLNPTPAGLAPHLAGGNEPDQSSFGRVERLAEMPLSSSQERLWFAHQIDPEAGAYHMPMALRVNGLLDMDVLKKTVRHMTVRHEILRTRFPAREGRPYLEILDEAVIEIEETRLPDQADAMKAFLSAWTAKPFDLALSPPWRLCVVNASDSSVLVLNQHHIIGDDWSLGLLTREFLSCYEAIKSGEQPSDKPLELEYADFGSWQKGRLESGLLQADKDYWQGVLTGLEPMSMPSDHEGTSDSSHAGDLVRFRIDESTATALDALAASLGVTSYTLFLSMWQTLLYRYGCGNDIRVGSSVAGRPGQATQNMLGCFVNTLVMRARLHRSLSFTDLLWNNRQTVAEALDHAELPYEEVQKLLPHEEREQLFSAFFVLHTANMNELVEPTRSGLEFSRLDVDTQAARFDLSLSLAREGSGMRGHISFRSNRFHQERIQQMVAHFQNLIQSILATPDAPVSSQEMVLPDEFGVYVPTPRAMTQPDIPVNMIWDQAQKTPDLTAICDEYASITYSEMADWIDKLTGALLEHGVKPEEVVAVPAYRKVETLVAMFAIQRAGAVCLPLEVDTPVNRLEFIAADARIRFGVDIDETEPFGAEHWDCIPVYAFGSQRALPPTYPDQTAYLVYTSGSTGTPKAVAVTHANLGAYLRGISKVLNPEMGDQWMVVTTLAADLGLTSIYPALSYGGAVHVMPREIVLDADAMVTQIAERRIDVLKCTPSWYRTLLQGDFPEMAIPHKTLLLGGESCDRDLVKKVQACSDAKVINHYGPSESTIGIVTHTVDAEGSGPVPIGRPLQDSWALVLSDDLQPVPMGVPGQLYLGGPQLSRGYFSRPALSADRFIPNPYSDQGERLYQSGDRVIRNFDGDLVFLGRTDAQIKIRGFRVELGEIEATLQQWVAQAAVLVLEKDQGQFLHAFVTGEGSDQDVTALLESALPAYMIPEQIQVLEQFPVSANGKLDRKALARIAKNAAPASASVFREAQSEQEKQIAHIWGELLNRQPVGLDDDFFKMGGDSIMAIQAMIRMRAHGVKTTPAAFFAKPTIAGLLSGAVTETRVRKSQSPQNEHAPLTPIQHWFFKQHENHDPHYFNQAILLELTQAVDVAGLRAALNALTARHEVFAFRYVKQNGEWRQIRGELKPCRFEVADFENQPLDGLSAAIEDHALSQQSGLNLQSGDLHRVVLYQTPHGEPDRLLFICHHLIVDGVSWRILLGELEQLYLQGAPADVAVTFTECAQTLQDRLPAFREQADFWRNFPRGLSISGDYDLGPNDEASTQVFLSAWDAEQTRRLLHDSPRHIHVYLLSALAICFRDCRNIPKLGIHLEGHGRDHEALGVDASQSVGWFTSIYPVGLDAEGALGEIMAHTQAKLDEIPWNGMGFGVLQYLDHDRIIGDIASEPQVIFNYLGRFDAALSGSRLFKAATEKPGPSHAPSQIRRHLIDINASVSDGHLRVAWRYSKNRFDHESIQALVSAYYTALQRLLEWETATMEVHS